MGLKVIMDSGKEYQINVNDGNVETFISSLYNENTVPSPFGQGSTFHALRNSFDQIDEHTYINPAHISSIEIESETDKVSGLVKVNL